MRMGFHCFEAWSGGNGTFIWAAWIGFALGIIQALGGGLIGITEGRQRHTTNG